MESVGVIRYGILQPVDVCRAARAGYEYPVDASVIREVELLVSNRVHEISYRAMCRAVYLSLLNREK